MIKINNRKRKLLKVTACFLAINILSQTLFPTAVFALTGGPSQPEVQSFSPVGTSEMVNLSSGDFTYNIPLLDVGGYPINITYNGGVSMDQEASWVGLGWNINPGVINRNMRGLPDDFKGDDVEKEFNILDQRNFGTSAVGSAQLLGLDFIRLGFGLGVSYSNYTGIGFEITARPSLTSGDKSKGSMSIGLGITASSQSGVDLSPSLSFQKQVKEKESSVIGVGASLGLNFNSREGLKSLSLGLSRVETNTMNILGRDGKSYKIELGVAESQNGGGSISFSTPTYVPRYDMHMFNVSTTFSATLGGEFYSLHPSLNMVGYYSGQHLLEKHRKVNAYGYLYSQFAGEESLHDFNREKDAAYRPGITPNLPLTNYTYDVYGVSGQGIGGSYRLYRNDVGIVTDPFSFNIGTGGSVGVEIGLGNAAHAGVDFSASLSGSWSGAWTKQNSARGLLKFKGSDMADPSYETAFFKQAGEKTSESDPDFFNNMGGFDAVMIGLRDVGADHYATSKFVKKDYSESEINSSNIKRKKRQTRNQNISYLTASEAVDYALVKEIENYPYNVHTINSSYGYEIPAGNKTSRLIGSNGHHISEMQAVRPDGARYVYGIPAYNFTQKEVSFSVQDKIVDCQTGLVTYTHGTDNTKQNSSGLEHFYEKTTTPAYAHSYLLTAILSSDYSDLTGNGPSNDDLGSYTKINYSKVVPDYKWRVPFEENFASYNEGMKSIPINSDKTDDKVSYIYGEKELWYVHSIETRTHVADFILEDRLDGNGVQGEQGGLIPDDNLRRAKSMKRLKEIRLYSKPDKKKNGANATPIKVVHFEYDYSLCTDIGNNESSKKGKTAANRGGKLTLTKIYFTYGNSNKGKMSPYQFIYGSSNPNYNLKGYDRWGNYKYNPIVENCTGTGSVLSTAEFPYVEQDYEPAAENASAWSLTQIKLPSGGIIKVELESDDYAYVQDKAAMQMFKVTGTDRNNPGAGSNPENNNPLMTDHPSDVSNSVVYFKLHKDIPSGTSQVDADKIIREDYIRGIDQIYFKFFINLNKKGGEEAFEYVPGYAKIDNNQYGAVPSSQGANYTHGWVRLKESGVRTHGGGDGVNPISKAAWQFARLYTPRIAYGQKEQSELPDLKDMLNAMMGALDAMTELFKGFNRKMRNDDHGKKFIKGKSFIRLHNPDGQKFGGGARVKSIRLSDEWKVMAGAAAGQTSEYGQEYKYTMTEERNGQKRTISSGVAGYEPVLGGDENPFRQPIFTQEEKFLIPSTDYYTEKPMGESFFPSPNVVYRRVEVKNIKDKSTRIGSGSVVHEFYTAFDYPTITKETPMVPKRSKPNAVFKLLKIQNNDKMTTSQGYVVELNDMHGQQKAQWVYQEGNSTPISGVEYFYKEKIITETVVLGGKSTTITKKVLDNEVDVISKGSGNLVQKKQLGVEFDIVADMRESNSTTASGGVSGNLDAFLAAILPFALPMALPALSKEQTRYRSAVVTKIINRSGLIDRVVAHDLGASVTTENRLYDNETGEVLLTKTTNQFNDPVYNFTYPAHWAYDRMGPAYKNSGIVLSGTIDLNALPSGTASYFVPGDVLALRSASGNKTGWVSSVGSNSIQVWDKSGSPLSSGPYTSVKILKSGRKNQQATPIGNVTTLINPVTDMNGDGKFELNFSQVVSASAIEFWESWKVFCNCGINVEGTYNPYVSGKQGNWRAKKSYLYLTERTQNTLNNNTSIRSDGLFKSFTPFWVPPAVAGNWTMDPTNWTYTSEVTLFSPYGFELENKDALDRYSSALYGYNNQLPIGVANNSRFQETAYDGFEDFDFSDCVNDHWSFKAYRDQNTNGTQTELESHSGRRSIMVNENKQVKVKKSVVQH
jgi:hypothetical protein